jgi:hypothetical protein
MEPPPPVGPPVPASSRGQELVQTSELPIAGAGAVGDAVAPGVGPLGRPPWDALVRRPTPGEAPAPGGRREGSRSRSRKRSRRDPLDWAGDPERPPDPEWDEGVPGPIVVPMKVRVRSGVILLAMTTIFGVVAATAFLIVVVMAVGALDRF